MTAALETPAWLERVKYDDNGLVPCIVQERATAEVLMMAWMNADSLAKTLETGTTWFWSRSRGELWNKGATSGNVQHVRSLHIDCDGDTLLAIVDQQGPGACHQGTRTCWDTEPGAGDGEARHVVTELARVVAERDRTRPEGSYTTKLLEGGVDRSGKKVGEEAVEVVIAAKNAITTGDTDELANESADLLYHLLVLWQSAGIDAREIVAALEKRRS